MWIERQVDKLINKMHLKIMPKIDLWMWTFMCSFWHMEMKKRKKVTMIFGNIIANKSWVWSKRAYRYERSLNPRNRWAGNKYESCSATNKYFRNCESNKRRSWTVEPKAVENNGWEGPTESVSRSVEVFMMPPHHCYGASAHGRMVPIIFLILIGVFYLFYHCFKHILC